MKTFKVGWILSLFCMSFFLLGCPSKKDDPLSKLLIKEQTVGQGAEAVAGKRVDVLYRGWIYKGSDDYAEGKPFDQNQDKEQPFSFVLGQGSVIKGWDEGVAGMREGGKRTLLIPSNMAYGQRGAGNVIKPGDDLVFEVELLKVH